MIATQVPFVGKRFQVGLRRQKTWGADMAISFFFGEFGAGLFVLSLCYDFLPGLIAGLLITTVGKSVGHLMHLGRPERAWRAITQIRHSWLSRGLLSIVLYSGFGGIYILNQFFEVLPSVLSTVCAVIACAAALVIMLYQGLIMSHSASITLWASGLMPVIGMSYALLSGTTALLAIGQYGLLAEQPELIPVLRALQLVLLLVSAVGVWGLLHAAHFGSLGGRESVERLLKQDLASTFIGGVIVIGFGLTAALIAFAPLSLGSAWLTLASQITGFVCFRLLILKAANYDPIMLFARGR